MTRIGAGWSLLRSRWRSRSGHRGGRRALLGQLTDNGGHRHRHRELRARGDRRRRAAVRVGLAALQRVASWPLRVSGPGRRVCSSTESATPPRSRNAWSADASTGAYFHSSVGQRLDLSPSAPGATRCTGATSRAGATERPAAERVANVLVTHHLCVAARAHHAGGERSSSAGGAAAGAAVMRRVSGATSPGLSTQALHRRQPGADSTAARRRTPHRTRAPVTQPTRPNREARARRAEAATGGGGESGSGRQLASPSSEACSRWGPQRHLAPSPGTRAG